MDKFESGKMEKELIHKDGFDEPFSKGSGFNSRSVHHNSNLLKVS